MTNLLPTKAIVEKYFKNEKSNYWIAFASIELAPYYEKLVRLESNCPELVADTILHDYNGLKSGDEFFLPRLA